MEARVLSARLAAAESRLRQATEKLAILEKEIREEERRDHQLRRKLISAEQAVVDAADLRWQLRKIRASRWFRLGAAFRDAFKHPRGAVALPVRLFRALRPQRVALPPKREPLEAPSPSMPEPLRRPTDLRVAAILDEFSTAAFAPDCDLITFRPEDWRRTFEDRRPHILLVESAWLGNDGAWRYQIGDHEASKHHEALRSLIDWCRANDVPSVFWNKEDPIHFDRFVGTAMLFDHVFTTDERMVERYLTQDGFTGTAAVLPFAAQPAIHNPVALAEGRDPRPCFAGTYYKNRDPERLAHLEALLDAARPSGLVIYDRTFGQDSPKFGFPERFQHHIQGYLSYEETLRAYKRFRVFLNGSSVADSPTMVSRRVFELLASGAALVTAPNSAVGRFFGDLVPQVETEAEAKEALDVILHDDDVWRARTRAGVRAVFGEHTYRHRLATIARTAGRPIDPTVDDQIAVLGVLDDATSVEALRSTIQALGVAPGELIIGAGDGAAAARVVEGSGIAVTRVLAIDHALTTASTMRLLASAATSPWTLPLGAPGSYADLAICTSFARADVIAPARSVGDEHTYDADVDMGRALVRRQTMIAHGWPPTERGVAAMRREGVRFYAAG